MKCESLSNSEDNSEDLDYGSRTIITITLGFLCHQQTDFIQIKWIKQSEVRDDFVNHQRNHVWDVNKI